MMNINGGGSGVVRVVGVVGLGVLEVTGEASEAVVEVVVEVVGEGGVGVEVVGSGVVGRVGPVGGVDGGVALAHAHQVLHLLLLSHVLQDVQGRVLVNLLQLLLLSLLLLIHLLLLIYLLLLSLILFPLLAYRAGYQDFGALLFGLLDSRILELIAEEVASL